MSKKKKPLKLGRSSKLFFIIFKKEKLLGGFIIL